MVHYNALSMAYADKVQALANNSSWAEQIKSAELQESFLSYTTVEKKTNNTTKEEIILKLKIML